MTAKQRKQLAKKAQELLKQGKYSEAQAAYEMLVSADW